MADEGKTLYEQLDDNAHKIIFASPSFKNTDEDTKTEKPYYSNIDYGIYISKYTEEIPKKTYTEHTVPKRNGILLENLQRMDSIKITVEFWGPQGTGNTDERWGARSYLNALLQGNGLYSFYPSGTQFDDFRYAHVSNFTMGDTYPVADYCTFTVEFTAQPELYLYNSTEWYLVNFDDTKFDSSLDLPTRQTPFSFYPQIVCLFTNSSYATSSNSVDMVTMRDDNGEKTFSVKNTGTAKGILLDCRTGGGSYITDWTETKDSDSGQITDISWTIGAQAAASLDTSQYPWAMKYYTSEQHAWSQYSSLEAIMIQPRWYRYV